MRAQTNDRQVVYFLCGIGALVIVMAIPAFSGLFIGPSEAVAVQGPVTRSIASIPEVEESLVDKVDFDCQRPHIDSAVQGKSHVRLLGKNCGGDQWKVLNQRNGFTADVIQTGEQFTTDFIELAPGENSLLVSAMSPTGKPLVYTLKVNGRGPASNQ